MDSEQSPVCKYCNNTGMVRLPEKHIQSLRRMGIRGLEEDFCRCEIGQEVKKKHYDSFKGVMISG